MTTYNVVYGDTYLRLYGDKWSFWTTDPAKAWPFYSYLYAWIAARLVGGEVQKVVTCDE